MRPAVDVIVPFHGTAQALSDLDDRLRRLRLSERDTVTIVDNTRAGVGGAMTERAPVRILHAPERQSSYYARNRGVAEGSQPWLVFLDADVDPVADLADRYFTLAPDPRTAILVGGARDTGPASGRRESLAGRYARQRRLIDQANTLQMDRPYAKTANCAIRRTAFEGVDGFVPDIRSGGDADLCFRLQAAGWGLELRTEALADHRSRSHLVDLLGQRARHGSGAEWLNARYPGFIGPRRRMIGLARNLVEGAGGCVISLVRGDPEQALLRLLDPVSNTAFDLGRRVPNTPWREQRMLGRRVFGRQAGE